MKVSALLSLTKHIKRKDKKAKALLLLIVILIALFSPYVQPGKVFASTPLQVYYRPDRMAANTAANGSVSGSVCVKPSGAVTETSATIIFPSGWTIDTTTSAWTLDTSATNIPNGTTQWPTTTSGNATSANNGTKAVTFTVGDITATAAVNCFHFTATGSTTTSVTGDSQIGSIATNADSTARSYATSQVTSDQISVTASVSQLFSFSLTAGTHSLSLTPGGAVASSGTPSTTTISTNAPNGYQAWVKSQYAALRSTTLGAGSDIASATFTDGGNIVTLTGVTNGYVLDCQNSSGTPCNFSNANYKGNGSTSGGNLSTSYQILAGSANPANADAFTLAARAKVGATQKPATDYADTITINAAGTF